MRRAVAFCQVIERVQGAKTHKVSSKQIAEMFAAVVEAYREKEPESEASKLACEARHVDGSMNASEKEAHLTWLKSEPPADTCRILSNVRCLSEGVDVPALDAVLFLTPRNSQVDVVQSVGRVMRKAEGKKRGYVILPVVIPAGMDPAEALNDNKVYRVVWEVLQALRSHDDRFDALINKLDLIGKDTRKMEVIAITDKVERKATKPKSTDTGKKKPTGAGQFTIGNEEETPKPKQAEMQFNVGELEKALYARIVKKCGNRNHWDEWAGDIAKIAQTHIARITTIVSNAENVKEVSAFKSFSDELRDDLNDSITDAEVIEMLAQHLITKPVFDALFKDYSFASNNPVSLAMQQVLDVLNEHRLDKEADTLEKFYASVRMRAENIDNAAGKQKIVVELYDKFFRNAFPRMTERLGIVYTPVEVVDFIIHSINDLLKQEFDVTLGTKGVHIIDPFTGTGTFVTRLLQSGLIPLDQLPHKYKHEIHANEIVLLAYYIAAINIEAVYHSLVGKEYVPFEGICLTDTFQLYEKGDLISNLLEDNSARRKRQKGLDIRVIMGNPPYSALQDSANDNNQNIAYPELDNKIRETYAARSLATNKNGLYDSYIRAIRWASDRIGSSGIVGFVTNANFLETNTTDGLRRCLTEEFSDIYIFHLRGNARTLGELRKKEKDNVFGQGSRAPIAISFLVKNPKSKNKGVIHFHDIGDYLTTEQKLSTISKFRSITGINSAAAWKSISPDTHGDWLKQRDDSFQKYIALGDKKNGMPALYDSYSSGVKTQRDAWCYNASKHRVESNIQRMISSYNSEVIRFKDAYPNPPKENLDQLVDSFINLDASLISWTRALKNDLEKGRQYNFEPTCLVQASYRPFTKQWLYFNRKLNEMVYQMHRFFPSPKVENFIICISGVGSQTGFSCLITNSLPDLHHIQTGQCFPLRVYEKSNDSSGDSQGLFNPDIEKSDSSAEYTYKDGINDAGLSHFQKFYFDDSISKEDIFYYVYGLLHSPEYRERFADNLSKELPRIPCVKTGSGFWAFSKAGRELAKLHLNYESVEAYPVTIDLGTRQAALSNSDYRVTKMKFASKADKSTVVYNPHITIRNIPLEAYTYVVNGKPALEWVIERQSVSPDKDSGIVNDANLWATETMGSARYPLDLFCRVITVSLETQKIIKSLPALDI
jgi:predicted helicase